MNIAYLQFKYETIYTKEEIYDVSYVNDYLFFFIYYCLYCILFVAIGT